MIIINAICHQTVARGSRKKENHLVFVKMFYQFGPFPRTRSPLGDLRGKSFQGSIVAKGSLCLTS